MQVDPIKPALKATASERLKLKCDDLLSNFAFKFSLRRYIPVQQVQAVTPEKPSPTSPDAGGRGLHSSPVQLNLSRF